MAPAKLILASRSESRAQLLREGGYEFGQLLPPFNDPVWPDETAGDKVETLAVNLAEKKALSLLETLDLSLSSQAAILAGDTIGIDPAGRLVGQPRDSDHARQMIASFVNTSHQVITAVALVVAGWSNPVKMFDVATVRFGPIKVADIKAYIVSGGWRGKAGGYNLYERLDHGWPITVAGDPTTVVGLPMEKLRPLLAQRGVLPVAKYRMADR